VDLHGFLPLFRLFFKVKTEGVVPTYINTMKQRPKQLEVQVGGELYLAAKYIMSDEVHTHTSFNNGEGGAGGPTPGNNKQMFYPSILSGKYLVKNNFQVSIADFG
jgi:hypothetical protein